MGRIRWEGQNFSEVVAPEEEEEEEEEEEDIFFVVYFSGIWAFSSSRKTATFFLLYLLYQMIKM